MLLITHFLVSQCRAILLFWYGLYSYLAINSYWVSTHLFVGFNGKIGNSLWTEYGSLGSLIDCIQMQGYTMIKSFSPDLAPPCIGPVGPATMYGLNVPFNIVMTAVDLAGFLLAVAFVLVLFYELKGTGATNIGQGKYLQFSYRVQDNKTFKVLNWICVVFIVVIFVDTIRFMIYAYTYGSLGFVVNYCYFLLPTLLTLAYSAYALGSTPKPPFFDFEDDAFAKLQFSRGWREIMTNNNDFAQSLGVALL